jgi:hypothetical protein
VVGHVCGGSVVTFEELEVWGWWEGEGEVCMVEGF